jgi:undecaprenyl-phosphate 4-deoxy-4-formamido-L-arabinose transferase
MGMKNILYISAFRAFRTGLRDAFADYNSPSLLLDVLLSWGTNRFVGVTVSHETRREGESNYTFFKLVSQALLVLTGFSTAPLRLASFVGVGFTVFGCGMLGYVLATYFAGDTPSGFAFVASIIALVGGAQLFAIGIVGEYLATIFQRSTNQPAYVVKERAGDYSHDEA